MIRSIFCSGLASVDIREIGLYEVTMLLSLFGFGIGMMWCKCVKLC